MKCLIKWRSDCSQCVCLKKIQQKWLSSGRYRWHNFILGSSNAFTQIPSHSYFQENYTENFVQSILSSCGDQLKGSTLVVGGDGRQFVKETAQAIIKVHLVYQRSLEVTYGTVHLMDWHRTAFGKNDRELELFLLKNLGFVLSEVFKNNGLKIKLNNAVVRAHNCGTGRFHQLLSKELPLRVPPVVLMCNASLISYKAISRPKFTLKFTLKRGTLPFPGHWSCWGER